MTSAYRVKAGIIAVTVIVGVTPCVLLMTHRPQARSLSLAFESYGTDLDFYDVAFLRLTNSSDRTYCLPMTGGTNTFQRDMQVGHYHYSGSYMVSCEFSDQAHPMPQVSVTSWGPCLVLAPHSAVRLRVPLPPKGQQRRVAVLCAEQPSGSPRRFWTHGIGLSILRTVPHSVGMKLLFSQPAVLRVWSDRELLHPGEKLTK